jgi:hypothetical protein
MFLFCLWEGTEVKEKSEVIKHSAAIHIQNNITLLQRRAWNVLLANAYDELPTKDKYSIEVADLMRVLEFDSKNEEYLKEALKALITCLIEWNILGKDRGEEWGATTLLAQAKIKHGVCTYAYSPEMRMRLHNPRMYARISLSMQNKFGSKYAQTLWELCVDYLDEARNYGETPFISLTNYRKLIGVREEMYPRFKKFNEYVIKAAFREINEVSDFRVEVEYEREGRKITAVKFKVRRVQLLPRQSIEQGALFPDLVDMPTAVRALKNAGMAADEAWKIWQEGFNYVENEKRPTNLKDNPEAAFDRYIQEKVHLLKRQQEAGKVKNITGFLRTAIKKNYANPEFTDEEKKKRMREETHTKHLTERRRQLLEERKGEIETTRDTEMHQLCERIVTETPALLEEAAEDIFKANPLLKKTCQPGKALLDSYQEKPMLRVLVDQCLMERYPERFRTIRERYDVQLTALEPNAVAEERASA